MKLFAGAIVGGEVGVLPIPLDQARALIEAAHAEGKPVFAHPSNLAGLTVSMDSGVDVLAHTTPMTGPWPADLTARILAHRMALIPTLTLFEVEAKKFGESEQDLKGDSRATIRICGAQRPIGARHGRGFGRIEWRPIERHQSVCSRPSHRTRGTRYLRCEGAADQLAAVYNWVHVH